MENQELKNFSWTTFFLVTSFSFFLFFFFMKKLEGTEPRVFIWTGTATFFLGLISLFAGKTQTQETEE